LRLWPCFIVKYNLLLGLSVDCARQWQFWHFVVGVVCKYLRVVC
jgi:hypothetical protein